MKIAKAIEILEKEHEDTFMGSEKDWKSAVRLGIEALKFYKAITTPPHVSPHFPLPSETE